MTNDSSRTNVADSDTAGFEIHHVDIPAKQFMILSNDMARGKFPVPLRALERIILIHFLSLDSGMRMTRRHIDNGVEEGQYAVSHALTGLEQKGYLRRSRLRQSGGMWRWRWLVTSDPVKHPLETPPTATPAAAPFWTNRPMDVTCGNTASSQVAPQRGNPAMENPPIFEDCTTKTDSEDFSSQAQPSVDITSVGVRATAQTNADDTQPDHHDPCRLAGLSDEHKVQRLCGMFVSELAQAGLDPDEDYRRNIGNALYQRIGEGCTNRQLIDMTRRTAAKDIARHRSSSHRDTRTEAEKQDEVDFAEFWGAYPRQSDRVRAVLAWSQQRQQGVPPALLLDAARRYAVEVRAAGGGRCPYPHTWLASGTWRRYVEPSTAA